MSHCLNVYALPSLAPPDALADGVAVVIDVLRATTTIVYALEAGAREVLPCLEIDEARRLAASLPPNQALLGGERKGRRIDGFDLGNSPNEYTPQRVGGKRVVLTTTNGTRAILQCGGARRVLVAAFANVGAICAALLGQPRIHLVCAGTDGEYSRDDVLLAGLIVERLRQSGLNYELNAQATVARENWVASFSLPVVLGAEPLPPERLAAALANSPGGRNLTAIGMQADILTAATVDRFSSVPELLPGKLCIRLA